MAKENSQIQRFHDSVDAFYIAFHSTFVGPFDKDNFAHESNSNDHFEIESSNPADTIPVATFLRNEQLPDEIIKKQYLYVCSFESSYWKKYDYVFYRRRDGYRRGCREDTKPHIYRRN